LPPAPEILLVIGSHQIHRRSEDLFTVYRQTNAVLAPDREHDFFHWQYQLSFSGGAVRWPGHDVGVSVNRKHRHTVRISQVNLERNAAWSVPFPFDHTRQNQAILAGRKIRSVQFIEHTLNIEAPVGPRRSALAE